MVNSLKNEKKGEKPLSPKPKLMIVITTGAKVLVENYLNVNQRLWLHQIVAGQNLTGLPRALH